MAGVTRLELAASGVTGRRSNQLSYTPFKAVATIYLDRQMLRTTPDVIYPPRGVKQGNKNKIKT